MTISATSITTTTLVALPTMLVTPRMLRESGVLGRATLTSKSLRTLTAATRAISMVDSASQLFRTSITALVIGLGKTRNMVSATPNTDMAIVATVLVCGATEIFLTRRAPMAVPSKTVGLVVLEVAMVAIKTIAATPATDLTMLLVAMVYTMLPVVMVLTMPLVAMVLTLGLEATLHPMALEATLHPMALEAMLHPLALEASLLPLAIVATGIQDLTEATIDEATNGD